MKSILGLLLLFAVATSGTLQAKPPKEKAKEFELIKLSNSGKYRIMYLDETDEKVKIKIFNSRGRLIHASSVSNEAGFSRVFNLTNLKTGSYIFEVTSGSGSRIKSVWHYLDNEQQLLAQK